MKVLELQEGSNMFKGVKRISESELRKTLEEESVIVIGEREDLVKIAKEVEDAAWQRLFLCWKRWCPERFFEVIARRADSWTYDYSLKFKGPKISQEKVDRRTLLRDLFKTIVQGGRVALPQKYDFVSCMSPYCTLCKDTCRHNAIRLKDGFIVVDPDSCTSCGDCVRACPTRALYMPGLDERALREALIVSGNDIKKIVFVTIDSISPNDFDVGTVTLLWNEQTDDAFVKYLRRRFGLTVCWNGGCWEPEVWTPEACEHLSYIGDEFIKELISYGIVEKGYQVEIDPDLCDLCGMCSNVCPTNALQQEYITHYQKKLSFREFLCLGCSACVNSCHVQNAINRMGISGIRVISVKEKPKRECQEKDLVIEGASKSKYQCFLCGKPLFEIYEPTYIATANALKTLLETQTGSNVTYDEIIEKLFNVLSTSMKYLACEECRDVIEVVAEKGPISIKKHILKMLVLYLSCLHKRYNLIPYDIVEHETLRKLLNFKKQEDSCSEWENLIHLYDLKAVASQLRGKS